MTSTEVLQYIAPVTNTVTLQTTFNQIKTVYDDLLETIQKVINSPKISNCIIFLCEHANLKQHKIMKTDRYGSITYTIEHQFVFFELRSMGGKELYINYTSDKFNFSYNIFKGKHNLLGTFLNNIVFEIEKAEKDSFFVKNIIPYLKDYDESDSKKSEDKFNKECEFKFHIDQEVGSNFLEIFFDSNPIFTNLEHKNIVDAFNKEFEVAFFRFVNTNCGHYTCQKYWKQNSYSPTKDRVNQTFFLGLAKMCGLDVLSFVQSKFVYNLDFANISLRSNYIKNDLNFSIESKKQFKLEDVCEWISKINTEIHYDGQPHPEHLIDSVAKQRLKDQDDFTKAIINILKNNLDKLKFVSIIDDFKYMVKTDEKDGIQEKLSIKTNNRIFEKRYDGKEHKYSVSSPSEQSVSSPSEQSVKSADEKNDDSQIKLMFFQSLCNNIQFLDSIQEYSQDAFQNLFKQFKDLKLETKFSIEDSKKKSEDSPEYEFENPTFVRQIKKFHVPISSNIIDSDEDQKEQSYSKEQINFASDLVNTVRQKKVEQKQENSIFSETFLSEIKTITEFQSINLNSLLGCIFSAKNQILNSENYFYEKKQKELVNFGGTMQLNFGISDTKINYEKAIQQLKKITNPAGINLCFQIAGINQAKVHSKLPLYEVTVKKYPKDKKTVVNYEFIKYESDKPNTKKVFASLLSEFYEKDEEICSVNIEFKSEDTIINRKIKPQEGSGFPASIDMVLKFDMLIETLFSSIESNPELKETEFGFVLEDNKDKELAKITPMLFYMNTAKQIIDKLKKNIIKNKFKKSGIINNTNQYIEAFVQCFHNLENKKPMELVREYLLGKVINESQDKTIETYLRASNYDVDDGEYNTSYMTYDLEKDAKDPVIPITTLGNGPSKGANMSSFDRQADKRTVSQINNFSYNSDGSLKQSASADDGVSPSIKTGLENKKVKKVSKIGLKLCLSSTGELVVIKLKIPHDALIVPSAKFRKYRTNRVKVLDIVRAKIDNLNNDGTINGREKITLVDKWNVTGRCLICLEDYPDMCLSCSHSICSECLVELNTSQKYNCPICKVVIAGIEPVKKQTTGNRITEALSVLGNPFKYELGNEYSIEANGEVFDTKIEKNCSVGFHYCNNLEDFQREDIISQMALEMAKFKGQTANSYLRINENAIQTQNRSQLYESEAKKYIPPAKTVGSGGGNASGVTGIDYSKIDFSVLTKTAPTPAATLPGTAAVVPTDTKTAPVTKGPVKDEANVKTGEPIKAPPGFAPKVGHNPALNQQNNQINTKPTTQQPVDTTSAANSGINSSSLTNFPEVTDPSKPHTWSDLAKKFN